MWGNGGMAEWWNGGMGLWVYHGAQEYVMWGNHPTHTGTTGQLVPPLPINTTPPPHHLDRLHCPTHDSAYLLHGALPNGAEDGCLGRVGHDDAVEAEGAPVAESNLPLSGTSE